MYIIYTHVNGSMISLLIRVLDVCSYLLVGSLGVYILNSFLIFPVTTKYMYQLRYVI